MVLSDAERQGWTARNVAAHVNRVAAAHKDVDTYTEGEVAVLLAALAGDRLAHAWELALCGLRRGEIAGLRWSDVDLDAKTLTHHQQPGERRAARRWRTTRSRRRRGAPCRCPTGWWRCSRRPRGGRSAERLALGAAYRVRVLRGVQRDRRPVLAGGAVAVLA